FFLSFFGFGNHWFLKALAAMGSAVGASLAWPAADGLLIDVVYGRKDEKEEIAGLRGMSSDLAYIIGPIIAGFSASAWGFPITFLIAGVSLILGAALVKIYWK
ncbi:MAG TPA: MFS transporter, partial [Candidatus Bathyarchaeia archaeon]|nr:MFS transporter [Candidatus Bathyarchaeia archaeon]